MSDEELIVEVESLSHEGRGVASIEGKTLFLEGALPQERVQFRYRRQRKRFSEGEVTDVLHASSDRITPLCAHADYCGGCQLQHMKPSSQIHFKQEAMLEQLEHFGEVSPKTVVEPILGETFGYRRKARLGVRFVRKKDKVLVGFREKRTHYIAEIEKCLVLDPRVGDRLSELGELITGLKAKEAIAQIEVAMGDDQVALVFRNLVPLVDSDKQALIDFGLAHQIAVYLQSGGPETVFRIDSLDAQKLNYRLDKFNVDIQFDPMDFTQVNAGINQQLVERVVQWLDLKSTDHVLDLFCGLGNFTLPIARFCEKVVGVEGSQALVEKARHNARHNGIQNSEFFVSDLQTDPLSGEWLTHSYQKALLDPPRTGAIETIPFIVNSAINRLVYVSCNPATFARDIGELVKKGFTLETVGVLDMFPQTVHVESIALLQR